ncbi:MAG: ClpXP protease specificity-enhancing factor [Hydrogenophaga sp.]
MQNPDPQLPSTRPYLIRALHEWCTDHGFAPYLVAKVDGRVQVPVECVRDGEIVLNTSFDATSGLRLGDEYIEFKARFGGVPREILIPVDHVIAIYARENGQGMAFPPPAPLQEVFVAPEAGAGRRGGDVTLASVGEGTEQGEADAPPPGSNRPHLKRVK